MSAMEYATKFNEHTGFAPIYVAIVEMRMKQFEHGLKNKLKKTVAGHSYANFQEMYQKSC